MVLRATIVWLAASFAANISMAASRTCGVECAYGAVHAVGGKARMPFEKLLNKQYISQIGGSTGQDIVSAVRDLARMQYF